MNYEGFLKDTEKSKVLARIVTHVMGDGSVTNKYFAYFNKNADLLKNYERDILSLFPEIHITRGISNSGTSIIQVQNKKIIVFLKSLLKDYRSHSLIIPDFINKRELKKEFLQSIFDDEGCVALRIFKRTKEIKRNLTLSSNSLHLIKDIKYILEKEFKINSNKISKYTKVKGLKEYTNYVLSITGKSNFERFQKEINFAHPLKKEKLDKMISSYIRLASTT